MEKVEVIKISKSVLARLAAMKYEKDGESSKEQLIFPNKEQAKGDIKRISEQELRLLFIEEFKKANKNLFYSIETPTEEKYKFGKTYEEIVINAGIHKRSASLDMCVFERIRKNYKRKLNIEFKHKNTGDKNIAKDILKLLREKQDGAFIHLLDNTDSGTFCNVSKNRDGIFYKFYKSFNDLKINWNNDKKYIHLIILSLKQKILIHRKIRKEDLDNLKEIFFIDSDCGNIEDVNENGWEIVNITDK